MIGYSFGATVMMQLGSYQFSINTAAYQELRRRTAYSWAAQERFGKSANRQFTGPGDDSMTLSGVIYTEFRGGIRQLDEMRRMAARGRPLLLIDGYGRVMGHWIIESIEEGQSVFAGFGRPRKQEFTMQILRREP